MAAFPTDVGQPPIHTRPTGCSKVAVAVSAEFRVSLPQTGRWATRALGQKRKFVFAIEQTFKGRLHFESSRAVADQVVSDAASLSNYSIVRFGPLRPVIGGVA